jgi:DNA topoisomerase-3
LIFRYIYESAQCQKPVSRLWISSLTPEAIHKGFSALRPAADYDSLADAARGRSQADWLVGMNLSRAYSLADNEKLSVGRVQTPTLAMVVERELAIRQFVPEEYLEIVADFRPSDGPPTGDAQQNIYRGTWFRARTGEGTDKESRQKAMRLSAGAIPCSQNLHLQAVRSEPAVFLWTSYCDRNSLHLWTCCSAYISYYPPEYNMSERGGDPMQIVRVRLKSRPY